MAKKKTRNPQFWGKGQFVPSWEVLVGAAFAQRKWRKKNKSGGFRRRRKINQPGGT